MIRRLSIWTFFLLVLFPAVALAQEDLSTPEYRAKIDAVDVSKAPKVRISSTFLDKRGRPINPEAIKAIEIYCDGEPVRVTPKVTSFFEGDTPIDIALILPISQRFSKNEREDMKASFANLIDSKRTENARIAGFFDDGRAINVAPLGEAKDVEKLLNAMKPEGQPSFLYSSLDKAMEEMTDPAKYRTPARRAIILVTDAFDTYTFRSSDVQREIRNIHKEARKHDIQVYVVLFKPFVRGLIPMFEGLSRKTGGTYRYAAAPDLIMREVEYAWGEVVAQLQLDFNMPRAREGMSCAYSLILTNKDGLRVHTEPYREVYFEKIAFNWKPLIIAGIVFGVLLVIGLIVFFIMRRRRKKKAEEKAALEAQVLQEKIEKGEACPKCQRTLLPEWNGECLFCAREAAEEVNEARAQARAKALAEAEKQGKNVQERLCPVCNRTMMPQWKECLFCAAGIGTDNDSKPKQGIAPAPIFGAKEKQDPNEGLVQCPDCGSYMKSHWDTCLVCEANAELGHGGGFREPEVEQRSEEALRPCPECGRPMKSHWDICLYCEANHRLR